jgi:hypothetical protein
MEGVERILAALVVMIVVIAIVAIARLMLGGNGER